MVQVTQSPKNFNLIGKLDLSHQSVLIKLLIENVSCLYFYLNRASQFATDLVPLVDRYDFLAFASVPCLFLSGAAIRHSLNCIVVGEK